MKRALKCGISVLVFAISAIANSFGTLLGRKGKGSCVVLYYHSVPHEQRNLFASQLDFLSRKTRPILVDDQIHLEPGMLYSAVTFDDAFENFVDVALPELAKRKIPSTMFVITDALGKNFGPAGHALKVMSREQLLALPEDLVTIGSHTLSHPFLPLVPDSDARRELSASREKLEQMLARKIRLFSFPFGGFNEKLVELCREAGYQRIFTTLPEFAFEDPSQYVVGRVRVDPTDWPLEFRMKVAGAYRWLPAVFTLKRRIVRQPFVARLFGPVDRPQATPRSKIHGEGA